MVEDENNESRNTSPQAGWVQVTRTLRSFEYGKSRGKGGNVHFPSQGGVDCTFTSIRYSSYHFSQYGIAYLFVVSLTHVLSERTFPITGITNAHFTPLARLV